MNLKIAFSFIGIMMISLSCTKERTYVRQVDNVIPYNNYPDHCFNGYQDVNFGELSVDCGGPCMPCGTLTPTCVVANNTFEIGSTTKTPNEGTVSSLTTTGGTRFQMTGTIVGGGNYSIILGDETPVAYQFYTITSTSNQNNMSANQALVSITPSGMFLNNCIEGKVYFRQEGGYTYATICEATAWSSGFSPQGYSIKGHITCQ
jgi:hypothetical protein